ncbi:Uncharacterised protein [Pseudomonas fragi]|uniref:Uncharacterized protein n=1 Tax=Pseudomonas fragi TaxID=296 RepID=A0A449IHZ6_PSEFR|nr:Uncharacterised protein [Pseudomonas fragi]
MIKTLTLSPFTIIEVFNDDFFKIIKFSIWDEDSCETLPSLFFIIEKFDAFREILKKTS